MFCIGITNLSRWIFLNWDIYCDWVGYEPDFRVFLVPDDVQ
jgi:hypothetical protein